ncbi:uncharacterized protein LOC129919233 [Episyrphus balteatus]|uniref:uncharacterized protein LOC129919233 n=1 Tax=Episyrphus balteatus TaxID=286459 RepID=UPI0024855B90|nr:uncharacterized protein LOC129919233 [Episyrphus balteatus]
MCSSLIVLRLITIKMNESKIFYFMVAIASLVLVGLYTPAKCQEANLVDDVCLGCICEAVSGCNLTRTCTGDICGLFRITWFYWADSGKRTVNGEAADSPTAFENCVFDPICASQSVQNYMQIFQQDCNQDGKIDCYDYATIHKLGGYGCPGRISGTYAKRLNQCLVAYGAYAIRNDDAEEVNTEKMQKDASSPSTMISKETTPQTTETAKIEQITPAKDSGPPRPQIKTRTQFSSRSETNNGGKIEATPESTLSDEEIRKLLSVSATGASNENIPNNESTMKPLENQRMLTTTRTPDTTEANNVPQLNNLEMQNMQNIFTMKLDQMEKSENNYRQKQLSFQEKFLQAFEEKNRIDEERNEILKQMVKNNNKPSSDGVTLLKRQAIQSFQDRFFNILQRIEKTSNEHRERDLKFQETFLEAFLQKNRIENERNEILKQISKANKPSDNAPNYFLL